MEKVIENRDQYDEALARAYALMQENLRENTDKSNELEALSIAIERYETKHHPLSSQNSRNGMERT